MWRYNVGYSSLKSTQEKNILAKMNLNFRQKYIKWRWNRMKCWGLSLGGLTLNVHWINLESNIKMKSSNRQELYYMFITNISNLNITLQYLSNALKCVKNKQTKIKIKNLNRFIYFIFLFSRLGSFCSQLAWNTAVWQTSGSWCF